MSIGWAYSCSMASPPRASSPARAGESTAADRRPADVATVLVPALSATVIVSLLPVWQLTSVPDTRVDDHDVGGNVTGHDGLAEAPVRANHDLVVPGADRIDGEHD